MNLRDKYNKAIQTAKDFRMDGSAQEKDGKLVFNGTVGSEAEKNAIWDALKTVPDWRNDVVADIKVVPTAATASGGSVMICAEAVDVSVTSLPPKNGAISGVISEK